MKNQTCPAATTCPRTMAWRFRNTFTRLLPLLLVLTLPSAVQAQFIIQINGGTITIIDYYGSGGDVTIPSVIGGRPVTGIGWNAFEHCTTLTSVKIPDSVTSIGQNAFFGCSSLTNVTIGNYVTNIERWAFEYCTSLTSVTLPASLTTIGNQVFQGCTNLTGVYFRGNPPGVGFDPFGYPYSLVVYYLPGTMGWDVTFGGRRTAVWHLPEPVILTIGPSFGVKTNAFGFMISWATNANVVVEAGTNLANPAWFSVGTNTLTDGWSYFSDPECTNHPTRFYRVRSP